MNLTARLNKLETRSAPKADLMACIFRGRQQLRADPAGLAESIRERLNEPCPPAGLLRRIWEARQRVYGAHIENEGIEMNLRGRLEKLEGSRKDPPKLVWLERGEAPPEHVGGDHLFLTWSEAPVEHTPPSRYPQPEETSPGPGPVEPVDELLGFGLMDDGEDQGEIVETLEVPQALAERPESPSAIEVEDWSNMSPTARAEAQRQALQRYYGQQRKGW